MSVKPRRRVVWLETFRVGQFAYLVLGRRDPEPCPQVLTVVEYIAKVRRFHKKAAKRHPRMWEPPLLHEQFEGR